MIAALAAAALVCASPRVHDGDTIRCDGQRVRLWGEDAPELSRSPRCRRSTGWACDPTAMAFGLEARDRLIALTKGQTVTCEPRDHDRYGRIVALCRVGGMDLDREMVREGLARDYTRYSHAAYLADEARARREHLGMWAAGPAEKPQP